MANSTKYEYKKITIQNETIDSTELNKQGEDLWQLITAYQDKNYKTAIVMDYIFRRTIKSKIDKNTPDFIKQHESKENVLK